MIWTCNYGIIICLLWLVFYVMLIIHKNHTFRKLQNDNDNKHGVTYSQIQIKPPNSYINREPYEIN